MPMPNGSPLNPMQVRIRKWKDDSKTSTSTVTKTFKTQKGLEKHIENLKNTDSLVEIMSYQNHVQPPVQNGQK